MIFELTAGRAAERMLDARDALAPLMQQTELFSHRSRHGRANVSSNIGVTRWDMWPHITV
jgi:hypothetical protein